MRVQSNNVKLIRDVDILQEISEYAFMDVNSTLLNHSLDELIRYGKKYKKLSYLFTKVKDQGGINRDTASLIDKIYGGFLDEFNINGFTKGLSAIGYEAAKKFMVKKMVDVTSEESLLLSISEVKKVLFDDKLIAGVNALTVINDKIKNHEGKLSLDKSLSKPIENMTKILSSKGIFIDKTTSTHMIESLTSKDILIPIKGHITHLKNIIEKPPTTILGKFDVGSVEMLKFLVAGNTIIIKLAKSFV